MVSGLRALARFLAGTARGNLIYCTVDLSEKTQVVILLVPLDDAKE